jgi:hypothetical protein
MPGAKRSLKFGEMASLPQTNSVLEVVAGDLDYGPKSEYGMS